MGLVLRQAQSLRASFGEAFGDIPVYSLHRIKNLLQKCPIGISKELNEMLIRNILRANQEYKTDSENDWNCLISNNLVDVFERMDEDVSDVIQGVMNCPQELQGAMEAIRTRFQKEWDQNFGMIKQWFLVHYDELLYVTDKKIPWPIIQRLRSGLGLWIAKQGNIFEMDINQAVIEVAKETGAGESFQNFEEAWKAMGGAIFKRKNF
ncbi:MAG: hypothetical protein CO141_00720 [Candidatus Moranbacteria bacterium CG_4_9_14_3_um_filter_42_9]|nr:MAG: hypothetical protein CO141_00720 [Candidatus Moranbacteria bacterium CG_4_9_14_3_um_filter_42_9]